MKKAILHQSVLKEQTVSSYHIFLFAICFISTALGGTVSTLMSVYLPVVLKDLSVNKTVEELNDISGYVNAIFIFGWAFGGFLWGMIGDRIGRKRSLLFAIAFYGTFTILTGAMDNWLSILICRFLSGFGVGGVLVVSLILISEVWPSGSKAIYIGILSIAFPVGIFSAGLINYLLADWRSGFLVGIIPLILAVTGLFLMKESPQWQAHQLNKSKDASSVNSPFARENRRSLIFGSIIFGSMLIGLWAIFSWLPTWMQSLVTESDGQKERGLSMMFMGLGGLTGGFLSGWLVNFAGVRRSMVLCMSVCAFLSFILFKTNTTFSNIIYVEIAILALFFGGSQGVLSVYLPQLFSTGIRAAATGFCLNIGRIFTAASVLFIGLLINTLGGYGNAIFIFSLVFVPGLMVVLFSKDQPREHKTDQLKTATVVAEAS